MFYYIKNRVFLNSVIFILISISPPFYRAGELWQFFNTLTLRRIKDVRGPSFQIRAAFIRTRNEIRIDLARFPDNEIYVRIQNPEKIWGESITVLAPLRLAGSADDFLAMLLTLGALKQYGAKDIFLIIDGWQPLTKEDERLVSILGLFSKNISVLDASIGSIKQLNISAAPLYPKTNAPIHIDRVAYIQPRFRNDVEEAVARIKDARATFLKVETVSQGRWNIDIPSDLVGKNIVLLHSTETNQNILELLLTLSSLREAGVKNISLLNTYQGYARQDKEFNPGEGVSGHTILKAFNHFLDYNFSINAHYGTKSGPVVLAPEIWLGDPQARQIIQILEPEWVYNLNGFVQLSERLAGLIKEKKGEVEFKKHPLLLVAPDDGAYLYTQEAAQVLKERYGLDVVAGYLNKTRISPTQTTMTGPILGENGNPLQLAQGLDNYWTLLLDDETSTGGTIKSATYHLVKVLGADWNKIYTGVVHGKFPADKEKFYTVKDKEMLPQIIIAMDTIPLPPDIISASSAPLIAYAIKRILGR